MVNNTPAGSGAAGDTGSGDLGCVPGLGRFLHNLLNSGAWQGTVHGVAVRTERQVAHKGVNIRIISDGLSLQLKETYMSPAPRFIDPYLLEMNSLGEKKKCYGNLNCQQRKQGKGERSGKRKEEKKSSFSSTLEQHRNMCII